MNKALPKQLIAKQNTKPAEVVRKEHTAEALTDLMQDMKGAWQEAAGDLLQPRPEAIAAILKKVTTPAQ
jgi:hypothetical protein